ncbi:MAG: aminotransferase class IV [Alphaproteobacteria bacterium]
MAPSQDIRSNRPVAYVDGRFIPEDEAAISIFDRAFRFADAVFDTSRTVRHRPYKLREHLERLWRSLAHVRIDPGMSIDELEGISREVVARNARHVAPNDDLWLRQFVTRGAVERIGAAERAGPTIVVTTERLNFARMASTYRLGVPLIVPSLRAPPRASLDPRIKTTSRMTHNLAEHEVAAIDPASRPLMLDTEGFVSESTGANFFAVFDGTLVTAGDTEVLNGISRATALELAGALGIKCRQGRISPFDLANAAEAFITATSFCMAPVRSVNGKALGLVMPGPVTRALMDQWAKTMGHDFVAQAFSHLEPGARAALDAG